MLEALQRPGDLRIHEAAHLAAPVGQTADGRIVRHMKLGATAVGIYMEYAGVSCGCIIGTLTSTVCSLYLVSRFTDFLDPPDLTPNFSAFAMYVPVSSLLCIGFSSVGAYAGRIIGKAAGSAFGAAFGACYAGASNAVEYITGAPLPEYLPEYLPEPLPSFTLGLAVLRARILGRTIIVPAMPHIPLNNPGWNPPISSEPKNCRIRSRQNF